MKNTYLKSISFMLVLVLLANMLPMSVFAEEFQESLAAMPEISTETAELSQTRIVGEAIDKRTEYTKEFLLSNGLRLATVYPDAVHYETKDGWAEIDNTLTLKSDSTYTNTAGVWNVSFPQTLTGAKSVTIEKDGYTLSFSMAGELRGTEEMMSTRATATAEQFSVASMQASAAVVQSKDLTALRKAYKYPEMAPEKVSSRLTYTNVYQNTDITYDLDSNTVKESIVLNAYSSTLRGYRYTLHVGDMIPVLEEDGQITFYDSKQETVVMVMPAPYLLDVANEYNDEIQVQLAGKGSTYVLTYLLPQQWLAAEERAWPVILDPVITASTLKTNIKDVTVSEGKTYDNNWGMLQCGHSETYGLSRFYVMYENLPALKSSDIVVAASLSLYKHVAGNDIEVDVHKVNTTWTANGMVWTNKPAYNTTVEDYTIVGAEGYYTWNITDVVRDWYSGDNTGVMFKLPDNLENTTSHNIKQFRSVDYGSQRPTLAIYFRNNNGLESYWDYTSSSAGRAGTGYINNFTGNLVWVRNDLGVGGNRMPITIRHIYNANDSTNNTFGMGNGWRSNYNQLIYQWSVDSNYYVWEDADGTAHYFKYSSSNTYKDEDGLELTLTVGSNGTEKYCITDKNGNQSFFDTYGRLRSIKNNQQTVSNLSISYTSTSGKMISGIVDGAGRVYRYFYSNGLLTHAVYRGTGNVNLSHVICTYEGTLLKKLTDTDGAESLYGYTNGLLSSVTDSDDYTLTYTYHPLTDATWQPYRVKSVEESDNNGNTKGGSLTFEYAHNQTTVTDYNNNAEIYQFNDFGNTVCIQDDEGHATYTQYTFNTDEEKNNNTGNEKKSNQMTLSSKLQNTVGNRIKDSSFENGTVWSPHGTNVSTGVTTETAYYGNRSQKIVTTKYSKNTTAFSPNFPVYAGETVTVSAYIKNPNAHTTLELHYRDSATGTYPRVSSSVLPVSQDWQRGEVTFTNTGNEVLWVYIHLRVENSGTYYVDCIQAEKEETASRYNLIENGDFAQGNYGWSYDSLTGTDGIVLTAAPVPAKQLNNNTVQLSGNPQTVKHVYQEVKVSGSAGDSYIFAGWAKGDSVPLADEEGSAKARDMGLYLCFNNTDGTYQREYLHFNPDANDWQYAARAAVAQKAYRSINIDIRYDYNANTAYFDGIQLYKEEFGSSYTYDDKGNVKSVTDLQKQTTTYEYDTSSNLTKVIQNNQAKMTYTYDSWHNVKTATTQEGLVYNFTYDGWGNNTSVSITSGGSTMTSTATYSTDGNRLVSTTDALGKVTRYGYNEINNVLEWVQYPEDTEDTRTEYTYDSMYRMASAACETDAGNNLSAAYTYTDDYLTKIQTPSTTYNFTYGDFGLRTGVSVGNRTLATYNYTAEAVNDRKYDLDSLDYGNGDSVEYEYDNKGRITKETYEDGDTVIYAYDNNGALAKVTDSATGITTSYYYDLTDRLMKHLESGDGYSHSVGYEYDTRNNLTKLEESINGVEHTTSYTYDDDNRIESVTNGPVSQHNTYDGFGRAHQQTTKHNGVNVVTKTAAFQSPEAGKTSAQVVTYTIDAAGYDVTYTYTYDDNGNITSISDGTNTTSYAYDSANQLIRENNQAANYTYTWTYDNAGNILNRKEYAYTTGTLGTPTDTVTYTYGDSQWGDLLTAYDGTAITSDNIGNMLSDGTWTYTWQHGRQLASMTSGTTTWDYTYNADGLRTKRTNGTDTYSYIYNGSQLTQMTKGADTLYFTYDAGGAPLSVTYNGTIYYYVTNLQGDVAAILNDAGNPIVTYTYDAWGNPLSAAGTMASTLGTLNPLLYRGYVYDTEYGLYYLQSRYYNPEIGRFINADNYPSTGQGLLGNNMFSYCGNNPIGRKDGGGEWWHLAIGAAVGVLTQYAFDVASNLAQGKEFIEAIKPSSTLADYGSAAVSGALAASGIGLGASIVANAGLGGITYLVNCGINGKESNLAEFSIATVAGAVGGAIGGSGANGAKLRGVYNTSTNVISNSSSAKKVAMYAAKQFAVKKTIAVSTARTVAAGFSANYLNAKREQLAKLLPI